MSEKKVHIHWTDFLIDGRKILSFLILSILSIILYIRFNILVYPFYDLFLPYIFYVLEYQNRNFVVLFALTYNILFSYIISLMAVTFFDSLRVFLKGKTKLFKRSKQ